jgi:uncharacterized protein
MERIGSITVSSEIASVLTERQQAVSKRVLGEEEARREHLVVYLSGAHAYGFPSPDSDLDLKAIHIASTEELLGLDVPPPTYDRAEILDGEEIDYTSNELAHALLGILAGNGNFLERVLGRMVARESLLLHELRPLVQASLSHRVHRHYRGFALNQLRFAEKEPTVKKLLYVLRTALTGIHVLETGELETDVTRLLGRYDLAEAQALVEAKRAGERTAMDPSLLTAWMPKVNALFTRLDTALTKTSLPEEPPNQAEIRNWLLSVRKRRLA